MEMIKYFIYTNMTNMENLFFYFNDEYINAFGDGNTYRMQELTITINSIAQVRCDLQKELDYITNEYNKLMEEEYKDENYD